MKGLGSKCLDNKRIQAQRNFRYFINILSRKTVGRFEKINIIPVLEGDEVKHLHYHMIIMKPGKMTDSEFRSVILESWKKTDLAGEQVNIQEMYSSKWCGYISK